MIKLRVLALILTLHFCSNAQNLVMNPSFEDTIPGNLVNYPPSLQCYPWFLATAGTVDYFNAVYPQGGSGVPHNVFGYQNAKSGNAYCGIVTYAVPTPIPDYREYLEGILLDTLQGGHTYCVSFYVASANNIKYYTSNIGLYFSKDSVFEPDSTNYLLLTPHIINNNGIIYDTLNWTPISGSYIALGGEKFIVIGNFGSNTATILDSNSLTIDPEAYYYIDDVSVVDCTVGIEEIKNQQLQFTLAPNPVKDKLVLQLQNNKGNTYNLTIFNAMGATVLKQTIDKNSISIDVSLFNAGVYFVKVSEASGVAAVKRFIKW